jgi:hypothetical protein
LRVTEAADRLQLAVSSVDEAALSQNAARNARAPAGASIKRAKAVLLRKHLHPIAADGLELFAGLPGIEDTLRVPRSKDAPAALLKVAERVRRVAVEHEQEFITQRKYGEDFLEQFDESVQALELALRLDRASARARYTQATREVKACIANVRRALDVLDTTMQAVYLDDKETLARWRHAIRVPARRGRPKKRRTGPKRAWREEQERAQSARESI